MESDQIKKVGDAVLDVYKTHNPSYNPLQRNHIDQQISRVSKILGQSGLPTDLHGKSVLDVACGTGEYTIAYSFLGADVTGVDFNSTSTEMAAQLFKANGHIGQFTVSDLFELTFPPASFDVVSSIGTLHHTANPRLGFERLAKHVKPGGFFVLNIADTYGCWLRRFSCWITVGIAGDNRERRVWWSSFLWWSFLRRTEKFGGRPRMAVIYDWFVNPQHSFHKAIEVNKWFADADLRFVGCYPTGANVTRLWGRLILAAYCIWHQRHHSQVWYIGQKYMRQDDAK